jgi:hypothetical protein
MNLAHRDESSYYVVHFVGQPKLLSTLLGRLVEKRPRRLLSMIFNYALIVGVGSNTDVCQHEIYSHTQHLNPSLIPPHLCLPPRPALSGSVEAIPSPDKQSVAELFLFLHESCCTRLFCRSRLLRAKSWAN